MQLRVLRRLLVSARARGMPEITNHGKLFFREKTVGGRSLTSVRFSAPDGITRLCRFNRPGNNPAEIRAEDRTSGRGRCKPGFDGEARIVLRPAPRLQSVLKANEGSIAHRM